MRNAFTFALLLGVAPVSLISAQQTGRIVSVTCPDGREVGVDFPVNYTTEQYNAACGVSGGGSSGSAATDAYAQAASSFIRWLLTPDPNAAVKRRQQELMRHRLDSLRVEAEKQHRVAESRHLAALVDSLGQVMKLEGLPHLQLKTGSAAMSSDTGYGICGLPGIATGGQRPGCPSADPVPATSSNLPPLQFKMSASDSGVGYGICGLPGLATHGERPDCGRRAPFDSAESLCRLPLRFARAFQSAVDKRSSAVVMVQPMNTASFKWLAEGKAVPKPMWVSFKTATSGPVAGLIPWVDGMDTTDRWGRLKRVTVPTDVGPMDVLGDAMTGLPYTSDADVTAIAHREAPGVTQDPGRTNFGHLTPADQEIVTAVNEAAGYEVNVGSSAGLHPAGAAVVTSGPANLSPDDVVLPKYPMCAFEPSSGGMVLITSEAQLKQYFNALTASGYHVQPDPRWNWGNGPPWR